MDRKRVIGVVALALGAGVSNAGLTGVQQTRSISARTTVGGVTDGPEAATGVPFALFDEGVSTSVAVVGGSGGSAAVQLSEFRADRVVGQGSVSSSAGGDAGFYEIRAASVFDLVFGVDRATEITVLSSISGTGAFELREMGGGVILAGNGVVNTTLVSGVQYRLTATAGASLDGRGSEGGGYSFQLIGVPAPGGVVAFAALGVMGARRRR